MDLPDVVTDMCRIHGKGDFYFSETAKGWVCRMCVFEGYYIDEIRSEVLTKVLNEIGRIRDGS